MSCPQRLRAPVRDQRGRYSARGATSRSAPRMDIRTARCSMTGTVGEHPVTSRGAVLTCAPMARRRGPLKVDPVAEATSQWASHGYDCGPRLQASLSLLRAESIVRDRNVEGLRPYGLTFGQHEVLMLLSFTKAGELPLGKIGERLMVHPTSVSNSVDALAEL